MESDLEPVERADNDVPAVPGDQPGADISARLLLALTTLYVQRSNHTAEEERQYTELALGLIDKTSPATRAAVAARLLRHPDAPGVVLEGLGGVHLSHDGGRDDGQDRSVRDPEPPANPHVESDPCAAGLGRADGEAESSPEPTAPAPATPQPASLTTEFGEAFFAASPPERLRMLSLIAGAGAAETAPENGRRFHVRIDVAAWRSCTGAFARDFEQLIDAPKGLCERILNDPSGEPMAIAAKATGMPVAVLQRILLLVSPATSHSVARVHELTELYHGLDAGTARDFLAAWRNAAGSDDEWTAPITDLRARFGALNARIRSHAVISRSGQGSGAPHGLRSR